MTKTTFWICSYPKSGNTWLRVLLANLLRDTDEEVPLNNLATASHVAAERSRFDLALGLRSSDLRENEIDALRPRADELAAREANRPFFRKLHDAYRMTPLGEPLISSRASAGVIYLIRNPLDVLVSFAHHRAASIADTLRLLNDSSDAQFEQPGSPGPQFALRLAGWSGHVRSWTEQKNMPICVIRYEDLLLDPLRHFGRVAAFAGLNVDQTALEAAIKLSSFERLKEQERRGRFTETPARVSHFFRQGRAGDWKGHLTSAQVREVIAAHGETMRTWDYLAEAERELAQSAAPRLT